MLPAFPGLFHNAVCSPGLTNVIKLQINSTRRGTTSAGIIVILSVHFTAHIWVKDDIPCIMNEIPYVHTYSHCLECPDTLHFSSWTAAWLIPHILSVQKRINRASLRLFSLEELLAWLDLGRCQKHTCLEGFYHSLMAKSDLQCLNCLYKQCSCWICAAFWESGSLVYSRHRSCRLPDPVVCQTP